MSVQFRNLLDRDIRKKAKKRNLPQSTRRKEKNRIFSLHYVVQNVLKHCYLVIF